MSSHDLPTISPWPQARFTTRVLETCERAHLRSPSDADGQSVDYRTVCRPSNEALFLCPLGAATSEAAAARFLEHGGSDATPTTTRLSYGRTLRLLAAPEHGVAQLSFAALCDSPLGASDYIALAQQYHTLFLHDVPQLSLQHRDQARRSITPRSPGDLPMISATRRAASSPHDLPAISP